MQGHTQTVIERAESTRFTVTTSRSDNPTAPAVVIAPALGMQARYYFGFIDALAATGIHGVVVEQRGHEATGGRQPSRSYNFGYAEMVADLGVALDTVRGELPRSRVYVLGHCLGGQIATMYAALNPSALNGIVFVASSTPHWPRWGIRAPKLLAAGIGFPFIATVVGHFPGNRLGFGGREARGLLRDWGKLARTGRFVLGDDRVKHIALPVLAVSVARDPLGLDCGVDALIGRLPGAEVTREYVDLPGVDHFRWAKRPDTVIPMITRWLRRDSRSVQLY